MLNPKINLVGDKIISIFDSSNKQKQNNMKTTKELSTQKKMLIRLTADNVSSPFAIWAYSIDQAIEKATKGLFLKNVKYCPHVKL